MPTRREPIILVELIRFACALAVMAGHYLFAFWAAPSERQHALLAALPRRPALVGHNYGWLGVELFFVISGMMIARSAAGAPARSFLRRRAVRLAPAAWLCATVTAATLALAGADAAATGAAWLRSVLFVPMGEQIDGVYWTLGIECCFYAMVALVLGDGRDPRVVARLGAGLAVVSALYWALCFVMRPDTDPIDLSRPAQLLLLPHGCLFALGIALTRWHAGERSRGLVATTLVAATTAAMEVSGHVAGTGRESGVVLSMPLALALFAAGTGALALAPIAQRRLARVPARLVATLGLMTYPLYLVHQDAGAAFIVAGARAGLPVPAAIGLTAALMLALAWLVVRRIEAPLAARLGRLLEKRSAAAQAPSPWPAAR